MYGSATREDEVVLENVPRLADVAQLKRILSNHRVDIAIRGRRRYLARLVPHAAPSARFTGCRPDASYLITGGLGILGLEIGKWLAEQGARHVVLTGRTPLPPRDEWDSPPAGSAHDAEVARKIAGIRAIEWLGATVHVAALDVADEPATAAFFGNFGASIPPLGGIVHAAATMGAARLREMSAAALAEMIRPKADGAWVLHRLTEDMTLDFFVLFSSISALIGTTDLGHYAAANSTLDAFAQYRRARGLTALSVNWGAWANLRGSEQHKEAFARSGMGLLASRSAFDLLGRLIAGDVARAVVADVDWKTFKPVYEVRRRRPFLDAVDAPYAVSPPQPERATLRDELAAIEPDRQADAILTHVRAAAAGVLGLAARQLDPNRGFFDLGMDSLLSVELRRRLEASTGLALPGTLTFKYPSVTAVADFLGAELLAPAAAQSAASAPAPAADTDAGADDLSEDDLAALLASKLAQIQ